MTSYCCGADQRIDVVAAIDMDRDAADVGSQPDGVGRSAAIHFDRRHQHLRNPSGLRVDRDLDEWDIVQDDSVNGDHVAAAAAAGRQHARRQHAPRQRASREAYGRQEALVQCLEDRPKSCARGGFPSGAPAQFARGNSTKDARQEIPHGLCYLAGVAAGKRNAQPRYLFLGNRCAGEPWRGANNP